MLAHSAGVVLEAKAQGGVLQGLKRSMLSGESFFVTTYTAPPQGGWVDVTGVLPGDLIPLTITSDRPVLPQPWNLVGQLLRCDGRVQVGRHVQPLRR